MSEPKRPPPRRKISTPSPAVIGGLQSDPIAEPSRSSSAHADGESHGLRPLLGEEIVVDYQTEDSRSSAASTNFDLSEPSTHSLSFHHRMLQHRMVSERLHTLGLSMKFEDKLKYLQHGHCLNRCTTNTTIVNGRQVEEKFEKYFGYLARCEGKFWYIDPKQSKFSVEIG